MELGKINKLTALRSTDPGFFLVDDEDNEVLLPNAYVTSDLEIGNEIEVFVYKDSEDRIVATTETPKVMIDQFAFLKVKDVNRYGAFMDWGLQKDLMVPYAEQRKKMEVGKSYVIFLLEDEVTHRLIGSNKINDFVFYDEIDVKVGEKVDLLLYEYDHEYGMFAVVNNLYKGLIFKSNIHKMIHPGDKLAGYVKQIRKDGKLDIVLEPIGYENNVAKDAKKIIAILSENNGILALTDKSLPDDIKRQIGLSKKAFKKAIGYLFKDKKIEITPSDIRLV